MEASAENRSRPVRSVPAIWFVVVVVALIGLGGFVNRSVPIPAADDLRALFALSAERRLPVLLEFAAFGCVYCHELERGWLSPLVAETPERVLVRRLRFGAGETVIDVDGRERDARDIATRYGVALTPTVLLLDAKGREIAPRQVGMGPRDYLNAYLEAAIAEAVAKVSASGVP